MFPAHVWPVSRVLIAYSGHNRQTDEGLQDFLVASLKLRVVFAAHRASLQRANFLSSSKSNTFFVPACELSLLDGQVKLALPQLAGYPGNGRVIDLAGLNMFCLYEYVPVISQSV
jgi:hypothetical protein